MNLIPGFSISKKTCLSFLSLSGEGPGETNWKNLHFQLFHTNTLANSIKFHQMTIAGETNWKNLHFQLFHINTLTRKEVIYQKKRGKTLYKWVNIAPKPNKYCTIFT